MTVFKTPYFCYGVMFRVTNHLNKELVYGITVNAYIFIDVVI